MANQKHKTNKSAAKRFKKTASGKLKRATAGRGHLLTSKNRKRKRKLRSGALASKADQARIALVMPK